MAVVADAVRGDQRRGVGAASRFTVAGRIVFRSLVLLRSGPAMRTRLLLALATLLGGLPAQFRVFGVSYSGTTYRLDAVTGTGVLLGATGTFGHGALASIGDALYTADLGGQLLRIDPWTGAVTTGPAVTPALNAIRAMAADSLGRLYVIQNGGGPTGTTQPDQLFRVDVATGAAVFVGNTASGVQGLAMRADDVLFGWDTSLGLVQIATANGAATDVNPFVGAGADIQAMAFGPDGRLYGARNALFTINTSTGATTQVGSGGYSDLRGIEFVTSPRIHDNGPLVTHSGGGAQGGDRSAMQYSLGMTAPGWFCGQPLDQLADDFQTNGAWSVDCIELYAFQLGATVPSMTEVSIAIYDDNPAAGGQLVPGSPSMFVNLVGAPGYVVENTMTRVFRCPEQSPLDSQRRIQRIRIFPPTPFVLDSSTLPSGRYWLRMQISCPSPWVPQMPPVTTLGLTSLGNAIRWYSGVNHPIVDVGPQALPFVFYGTSNAPPASMTSLGGGCGPAANRLDVRGAPVAGGTVVHQLQGTFGFPGIVIGFSDPNVPFAPVCGCVLHASLDFIALGTSRYDLVAPAGVGTGFSYHAQGLQFDFSGVLGYPCHLGFGSNFHLTDAYRVRFW